MRFDRLWLWFTLFTDLVFAVFFDSHWTNCLIIYCGHVIQYVIVVWSNSDFLYIIMWEDDPESFCHLIFLERLCRDILHASTDGLNSVGLTSLVSKMLLYRTVVSLSHWVLWVILYCKMISSRMLLQSWQWFDRSSNTVGWFLSERITFGSLMDLVLLWNCLWFVLLFPCYCLGLLKNWLRKRLPH